MVSFGEGHVTIISSNPKKLVLEVSQIMRWYRKDFYTKPLGLVGIIFYSIRKGDEPENADVFLEYFDQVHPIPENSELAEDGLLSWKPAFFEGLLKPKKQKKFQIKWKDYDWGTNSK